MFIPTSYDVVPWDYDEHGTVIIGRNRIPSGMASPCELKKIEKGKLWFSRPVFNDLEWAYPEQKDKLIALLSCLLIHSRLSLKDSLLAYAIQYSSGCNTRCDWLFTEKLLFLGKPNMTLAQLMLDIECHFLKFDFHS